MLHARGALVTERGWNLQDTLLRALLDAHLAGATGSLSNRHKRLLRCPARQPRRPKLPTSTPMTVTRYSCPTSISSTARAWPAGVAAVRSPYPVVVGVVKLK